MQKHLDDLFAEDAIVPEWAAVLRELDRLQQVRIRYRDADWMVRTDAPPSVTDLYRRVRIALPPRARKAKPPDPDPPPNSTPKRRGRPRRSATASRISPKTTEVQ